MAVRARSGEQAPMLTLPPLQAVFDELVSLVDPGDAAPPSFNVRTVYPLLPPRKELTFDPSLEMRLRRECSPRRARRVSS